MPPTNEKSLPAKEQQFIVNEKKRPANEYQPTANKYPFPVKEEHREELSLYIHIPFCLKKCRYCDFLSAPQDEETRERYVRALVREIRCRKNWAEKTGRRVDTVFLGGGTPSVLTPDQVGRIMEAVYASFYVEEDAEISMELNPGTADQEKMRVFRQAAINRLSIGVQSLQDQELRLLGRIHNTGQAKEAFLMARKAGFENVNVDLMSALPGQTFSSWADSLAGICAWEPEHISAYSLIMEPGTEFAALQDAGKLPPLPDEDTDREMYRYTESYLADHGYEHYEISNYAKPGRECRHNCGYWTGHQYLGLGIGAASYVDGARFSNTSDIQAYLSTMEFVDEEVIPGKKMTDLIGSESPTGSTAWLEEICTDQHVLTEEEKMEEFMFLGLRMCGGIEKEDFERRFPGHSLEDIYGKVIRRHLAQGVMEETEKGFRLTERGIDISNYILADYLL